MCQAFSLQYVGIYVSVVSSYVYLYSSDGLALRSSEMRDVHVSFNTCTRSCVESVGNLDM